MSATITLRVTGNRQDETWSTSYSDTFTHHPEEDVDQLVGLGPTEDGETFSGDCIVNTDNERTSWESLLYTDTSYDAVYWYVKAPGDTSAFGSFMGADSGDGVTRKSTMTTRLP